MRVMGIDNDPVRLDAVRAGQMPFRETGTDELLARLHPTGLLALSDRVEEAAAADHIVITLGTPSFSHIEIDMRGIRSGSTTCSRICAPDTRSRCAPRSRRARPTSSPATSPSTAAS